jgi:hypothetical protein
MIYHFEVFLTVLSIPFSSACQDTSLPISLSSCLNGKEAHLTRLETVLLCFFPPSEDSLLSIEGLSGSLAEPPTRPELEDILLSDITMEIEVKPGSVLCLSLSLSLAVG